MSISTNELSFASVESWKDIYGCPRTGDPAFPKSKIYKIFGAGYKCSCIGSELDPVSHGGMKKSLSAAFSTKALAEQEHIIQQCVDGFIQTIGLKGTKKALNMSDWFGMISFDILGEMARGLCTLKSLEQVNNDVRWKVLYLNDVLNNQMNRSCTQSFSIHRVRTEISSEICRKEEVLKRKDRSY